jgi:hypothetical protein
VAAHNNYRNEFLPEIRKTIKWPKKALYYLLQCALSITYSKLKQQVKTFLSHITDISETLIHADHDTLSSSCDESIISTMTPSKQAPKKHLECQLGRKMKKT